MGSDYKRLIFFLLLLAGIFVLPWYFLLLILFISALKLDFFYEGFLIALLYDIIFGVQRDLFFNLPVLFLSFSLIYFCNLVFKKEFRV